MGSETNLLIIFAFLVSCLYFGLSVSLLAVTDFGQQTTSRDIAIALAVLTGLPIGIAVLVPVVLCLGLITGRLQFWA
jgi:uncharacterized membrane protein (DUF485 family)